MFGAIAYSGTIIYQYNKRLNLKNKQIVYAIFCRTRLHDSESWRRVRIFNDLIRKSIRILIHMDIHNSNDTG